MRNAQEHAEPPPCAVAVTRPAGDRRGSSVRRRRARVRQRRGAAATRATSGLTLLDDLVAPVRRARWTCDSQPGAGDDGRARGAADDPRAASPTTTASSATGSAACSAPLDDIEVVGRGGRRRGGGRAGARAGARRRADGPRHARSSTGSRRRGGSSPSGPAPRCWCSRRSPTGRGSWARSRRARVRLPAQGRASEDVAEGIRAAARGESPLDPRAARTMLRRARRARPARRVVPARARGARAARRRACRTS